MARGPGFDMSDPDDPLGLYSQVDRIRSDNGEAKIEKLVYLLLARHKYGSSVSVPSDIPRQLGVQPVGMWETEIDYQSHLTVIGVDILDAQ